jgi:hypothetical protein
MTEKIPGPVYRINTPRLVIRCWNPEDAGLLKTAIDRKLEAPAAMDALGIQ